MPASSFSFFFNDTATSEIYPLSLLDALPICGDRTRYRHFFNPSPGLTSSHSRPPMVAIAAAKPSDMFQPKRSASQGVSVGESVPPTLAPAFMMPDSVPAWRGARSMVLAQKAPTG